MGHWGSVRVMFMLLSDQGRSSPVQSGPRSRNKQSHFSEIYCENTGARKIGGDDNILLQLYILSSILAY